jgi:purine-binding chemotaxis protein CheW
MINKLIEDKIMTNQHGKKESRSEDIIQIVTFLLADEKYGVDIMVADGVETVNKITPIPNSLDFVEGVLNLRGVVIPIINLKKRFNLVGGSEDIELYLTLFIEGELKIGILIDALDKVEYIPKDQIQPPPPVISGIGREYISGVANDSNENLVIILDIDKLLSYEELEALKESQK